MSEPSIVGQLVRAGLEPDVADCYVRVLRDGPGAVCPEESAHLVASGLAEVDRDGALRLFAPEASLGRRAYQLESYARLLRQVEPRLESLFRQSWEEREPTVQYLRTAEAALDAFHYIQEAAREQVRALDRGPYINRFGPNPSHLELAALAAGISYRVIYSSSVLDDEGTRASTYRAVEAGEHARVLGEVPMKMLLADHALGLVAKVLPDGRIECFLVRPSLLLDTLHSCFDTLWDLAIPVQPATATDDPDEEGRMVLRGLAAGMTDDAIARELGISERTVARRIARLQDSLATRSRFQLGLQAARRGLL